MVIPHLPLPPRVLVVFMSLWFTFQGNPELRLALNEDLVVGKANGTPSFGSVVLDVSTRRVTVIGKDTQFVQ